MAQLNTSLSDMPWFGQPADPGASLARGVASGAQIANTQYQRASLAQQKMEFDKLQELRQAQEERAAALFPLVRTIQEQNMQKGAVEVEKVLEDRKAYIENEKDVVKLLGDVNYAFKGTSMPLKYGYQALSGALSKNWRLVNDPRVEAVRKQLDDYAAMQTKLDVAAANASRYEAQAERDAARTAATAAGHDLDTMREQRLQDQFAWRMKRAQEIMPSDKLASYRARVQAINNDIKLMMNYEAKVAKLKELDKEYGVDEETPAASTPPPASSPSATRFRFDINAGKILK